MILGRELGQQLLMDTYCIMVHLMLSAAL